MDFSATIFFSVVKPRNLKSKIFCALSFQKILELILVWIWFYYDWNYCRYHKYVIASWLCLDVIIICVIPGTNFRNSSRISIFKMNCLRQIFMVKFTPSQCPDSSMHYYFFKILYWVFLHFAISVNKLITGDTTKTLYRIDQNLGKEKSNYLAHSKTSWIVREKFLYDSVREKIVSKWVSVRELEDNRHVGL